MLEKAINLPQVGLASEQAAYAPSQEALNHPEGAAVGVFVELIEAPTRAKLAETLEARGITGSGAEAFGYVTDQVANKAA